MQSINMPVVLKVRYNDEIRRIALEEELVTFAVLQDRIQEMFPSLTKFVCIYKNSGITIELRNDDDVTAALHQSKVLRITIVDASDYAANDSDDCNTGLSSLLDEMIEETFKEGELSEKLRKNEDLMVCSGCWKELVETGIRFKCLQCIDTSYCAGCGHAGCSKDGDHLLVRLNRPVSELPRNMQMMFLRFIDGKEARHRRHQLRKELGSKKKTKSCIRKRSKKTKKVKKVVWSKAIDDGMDEGFIKIPSILPISCPMEELSDADESDATEQVVGEASQSLASVDDSADNHEAPVATVDDIAQTEQAEWDVLGSVSKKFNSWIDGEVVRKDLQISGISFKQKLSALEAMGFSDKRKNSLALARHFSNLELAIADLLS